METTNGGRTLRGSLFKNQNNISNFRTNLKKKLDVENDAFNQHAKFQVKIFPILATQKRPNLIKRLYNTACL